MVYIPAQNGSLVCAKGFFGDFHGLGSYFIRRHVLEIPYRINRYESGIFENIFSGFDCLLLVQIGPLGDKISLEMGFGLLGPKLTIFNIFSEIQDFAIFGKNRDFS